MATIDRVSRRRMLLSLGCAVGGAGAVALMTSCGGTQATAPASTQVPSRAAAPKPVNSTAPTSAPTTAPTPANNTAPTPATSAPTTAPTGQLRQLPRNETLIFSVSDSLNEMTDVSLANPFQASTQRTGWQFAFEPLYYYNQHLTSTVCGPKDMQCKDGEIPWLAESYSYNADYTELTIHIRPHVTWSDGKPFTANDVVFTINMLKDNAPIPLWSSDMKLWVKEAVAVDDLTAKIVMNNPNPRFMFTYLTFHDDIGFPPVPQHIFEGQKAMTFTNMDIAKGWPVVTGPWRLTFASSLQKYWDRRNDWWAAKTGFHPLPKMRRIIVLPSFEDAKRLQLLLNNEVDSTHDMQVADVQVALAQNKKLKVWTNNNAPPYGCIDYWTNAMSFNCSKPPFDDPQIRWAINHALDRNQIVQIGYRGAGKPTLLPFPEFPPMKPYFDEVHALLAKYRVGFHDPQKSAAIMESKGYKKDAGGFWAKGGKRFPMTILLYPGFFEDITPIIVAQLRKAGFAADFKAPANAGTIESLGNADAFISGIAASVREPYPTLSLYHSRNFAPTGKPAPQPYRWRNAEFDKLVDEMGSMPTQDPKFMGTYHRAMDIWLQNLPSIPTVQWYIRIPVNTTYWKNWPDELYPYIEPSNWHRTVSLYINTLQPA